MAQVFVEVTIFVISVQFFFFFFGGGGCYLNTIDFSAIKFRHMPSHASREILILFGSLTSCDPGDIHETIQVMYLSYWQLHAG